MSLLATRALSLTLGQSLFSDLSFTINPGDRIGLIAANGRGKSSLLALLAGQGEPTIGDITRTRGLKTALVAQEVAPGLLPLTFRAAALAALDPTQAGSETWRADIVMDDLAVPHGLRERPLAGPPRGVAVVITSHDRAILDLATNRSLFLRMDRSRFFALPYSHWSVTTGLRARGRD
jgi:ATPase subunit of ABC transporter with duplicated ATPase domains